jgi:uncharacterized protein YndB with AHSA1/START domain
MSCAVNSGFDQFKLRVNIKSSIEKIYKAWATKAGLESWFLREAVFQDEMGNTRSATELIQENDTYTMLWHGYPNIVAERGQVLKANGENEFSFTFSLGCPVSVKIFTEQDESIVELIESNLPLDEETRMKHYFGDSKGWVFYLTNLKSVLEGGLDLRNKKVELVDMITA